MVTSNVGLIPTQKGSDCAMVIEMYINGDVMVSTGDMRWPGKRAKVAPACKTVHLKLNAKNNNLAVAA